MKDAKLKLLKKRPWYKYYFYMKSRCCPSGDYGRRGIKCFMKPSDIKALWFRDKAYLMDRPTMDRIDNKGNYTTNNCRFVEYTVHREKTSLENKRMFSKKVNRLKDGKIVGTYPSLVQAAEELNTTNGAISNAATGKRKGLHGYQWQFC